MGIYDPLKNYLKNLPDDSWTASFAEIERIIRRPLPDSASKHRPWWANQKGGGHSQAKAWQDAGWETREVDVGKTVRFERRPPRDGGGPAASAPQTDGPKLPDLWDHAAALSGIGDREQLIEAALTALIQREAAHALIRLGGTMPDASAAPRERPIA